MLIDAYRFIYTDGISGTASNGYNYIKDITILIMDGEVVIMDITYIFRYQRM